MGTPTQAKQCLIAAETCVHVTVIFRIVFMHTGGDKDRVQIERSYAQFMQIGQLFTDTVQRAAIKVEPPASPLNGSSQSRSTISGLRRGDSKRCSVDLDAVHYEQNDRGRSDRTPVLLPTAAHCQGNRRRIAPAVQGNGLNPCGVNQSWRSSHSSLKL